MAILGPQTITVERNAAGTYVDGVYVPGAADAPFTVVGAIDVAPPRIVDMLPEAARVRARWTLYCDSLQTALKVTDLAVPRSGDKLTVRGFSYRVTEVGDWTHHSMGVPHRQYIMLEIGDDE
jgi:hypothetical protein